MSTLITLSASGGPTVPAGGAWVLEFETVDADGFTSSVVTPVTTVTDPSGVVTHPVPDVDGVGLWSLTVTPAVSGRWTVHLSTPEDAVDAATFVLGPTTAAGMPTASDVVEYLRNSSWSLAQVQQALNAERSAQRSKCGERNPYPDDLREALCRRVARNLAMRMLPLAVSTGDADTGPTILPGRDPEVRRLEAPYSRLVTG